MNDPARLEPSSSRSGGLSSRQAVRILVLPELLALSQNLGSTSSMDGSIDPSTAQQRMVGRIDDRVDVLLGDIALHEGDLHSDNTIAST
jgi:hypothetical protein